MANPLFLSFSLSLLILFHGCLARPGHQSSQRQNRCQLNSLEAREPDNRVEAEAGVIESWNHNDQQFQCTGSAVLRITIEQNGLHLPSYSNTPQLFHVVQGKGVLGVIFPGCPETFEESDQEYQQQHVQQQQQQGRQQGQQGQQGRQGQQGEQGRHGQQGQERQQGQQGQQGRQRQSSQQQPDRHQKLRRIREGDIVAIPAGVVYWTYNDGDQDLVAVNFHHIDNEDNQLDQQPRRFYVAGNPEDEFNPNQRSNRRQQGRQGRSQQGNGNNVYSGFDQQLLADALNVNQDVIQKLQGENDDRRNIVKVQGQLDLVVPPTSQSERQREQQLQRDLQQERQQHGSRNGIEETVCSMRLKENIADPSRADVYSPQAGRISTVDANNLPILDNLGLSAQRGFLYRNGIFTPHWTNHAHAVVYAIRGRARVQVVDDNGNNVFDDEVREGQVLPVPQNFVVASQASNEGFEWVTFKTHERSRITPLAGRLSVLRALPDQVLENAFQLSPDEVQNVKYNRRQVTLFDSSSSSSSPFPWKIIA